MQELEISGFNAAAPQQVMKTTCSWQLVPATALEVVVKHVHFKRVALGVAGASDNIVTRPILRRKTMRSNQQVPSDSTG